MRASIDAMSQQEQPRVPPYVALTRIAGVLGMSAMIAMGLFLLIGGWWPLGFVAFVLSVPFFGVMRLAERMAERAERQRHEGD